MMKIGIDPGISGAIAMVDDETSFCIRVEDMPWVITGFRSTKQVNAPELAKMLTSMRYREYATVYLEQVHAMPKQGVTSMFNFGTSYGIVLGVVGALNLPLVLVSSGTWKRRAGLRGKPKDASRTLAQQLYPEISLSRKKDIGRADAILIARYGEK